jgi:hypothetical protein
MWYAGVGVDSSGQAVASGYTDSTSLAIGSTGTTASGTSTIHFWAAGLPLVSHCVAVRLPPMHGHCVENGCDEHTHSMNLINEHSSHAVLPTPSGCARISIVSVITRLRCAYMSL